MSLRLKADSFREKMKSVRKMLSPGLHEPKLDESQSTSSESQHRTSRVRSSSSDVSQDNLQLTKTKTKTQNGHTVSCADAVRVNNDRARGRGIGSRKCIPDTCDLNLHLDINPGESSSGSSTIKYSDQATTQSQSSKGKSSSPASSDPQSTIRPDESASATSKTKFTVTPQQKADLEVFKTMLLDSDDELTDLFNTHILEKIKKLKAKKAKKALTGKPEPEPEPYFVNQPVEGVFQRRSASKDSGKAKSTDQDNADERKFKQWTDDDLDRQCEVMEKYNNGEKLWTKEDLYRVENDIKGDVPYVKFHAYAGKDEFLPNQKNLKDKKIRVEFHGFQDLSCPPASSPDNMLYSSLSLKVVDYDNEDYLSPSDHWTWTNCYKRSWKNLPISHELYAMFMRVPLPPIDKMVCIGLGPISFRPKIESFMLSRGVFNHLGALLIAEALRKRFGATPRLLAQDPEYHPDCKRMLQGKGFEIVGEHGAGGLAEIDGRTLVYAPNPGFCLKEVMADIAEPAAMFWKPVTTPEQEDAETKAENLGDLNVMRLTCLTHKRSVDPDTPRVRALVQKYDKHIFPNNNLYGKIALYTRRGSYRPHPERTCMPKVSRMSNDYARLDHSTRSGAPYSWQVARAPPQAPIDESTPSTSFAPPPPPSPPSSPPASPPAPQTGDAQPPSTTSCSNPEPEQLAIGDLSCLPRRRGSRYVWKYVRAPFITSNVPTDYALGEAEAHLLRISEYGPSRRRPQPQQQQEPEPQQQQEPQPQPQPEPQPQQQQEPRENRVESADGDEESFYRGLGYSF